MKHIAARRLGAVPEDAPQPAVPLLPAGAETSTLPISVVGIQSSPCQEH